jgi:hypothetical protein
MTAEQIEKGLIGNRLFKSGVVICPRYTPDRWFECDLIEITAAGFFREYEVKVTKADFRIDAEKAKRSRFGRPARNKHEELGQKSKLGPSRFSFVTPEGLLAPTEIPDFAGWIEVRSIGTRGQFLEINRKAAPNLHSEKFNSKRVEHLRTVFYWRYLRLLTK